MAKIRYVTVVIKQIHTFNSILFEQRRFGLGFPRPLSSQNQNQRLGQPRPKRRCSNNMLLVNVWICLMIMISQQEASLKQDVTVGFLFSKEGAMNTAQAQSQYILLGSLTDLKCFTPTNLVSKTPMKAGNDSW